MRRVRYLVAASLDSYIAGPDEDADWIIMDPDIDFGEICRQFDTVLMGRRTFETMIRSGDPKIPGTLAHAPPERAPERDHRWGRG